MTEPWYTTRERVKRALDVKETARNNALIDDAIAASSRGVDELLHRRFYPQTATRSFDWPNESYSPTWRFWLPGPELVSVTTLVSGGTTLTTGEYDLRRGDDLDEPPYNRIEIDLGSTGFFDVGDTHQKNIVVTGVWGYQLQETTVGTLAEALDASETAVDVSAACSALVGVGSLLRVGTERMFVTGRSTLDTGQVCSDLTVSNAGVSITGITAGTVAVDEVILVDSERMLVVDVAGTTLTVKRAYDGSTLAAHTGSPTIYAYRTLTVERGACGTTAATHASGDSILRFDYPGLVSQLTVAETLNDLLQQQAGYARTVGQGDNESELAGKALTDMRDRAVMTYGRQIRIGGV